MWSASIDGETSVYSTVWGFESRLWDLEMELAPLRGGQNGGLESSLARVGD